MVHMHDGGGGGAASAQEIRLTIEEIRNIANGVMAELQDRAGGRRESMSSVDIDPAAFGQTAVAQQMGQTAAAAHDVFLGTVRGIVRVLEQYQQNLIDTVNTYAAADDVNATDMARLTPDEILQRYQELNEQTIDRDEDGHGDLTQAEQDAFDQASEEHDFEGPGGDERAGAGPDGVPDEQGGASGPAGPEAPGSGEGGQGDDAGFEHRG